MKFKDRLNVALKVLSNSELSNSLGLVTRNFGGQSKFDPYNQVKNITFKAIDKIGLSLSVYEPYLENRAGDIIQNHPFYALQAQPNDNQSASDFTHLYGMLFKIYGETFWYIARGEYTLKPKAVYLLNPAQMEVKLDNGELVGYVLHKGNGEQIPFMPDEIIHDKSPNPFNEWRGMSVLERAGTYIDIELISSQFTLSYMANNASPSGIVSLPSMDKEAFKMFASQWRENYEGPQNAGKTAFIRGGEASFQAVGATLKDVDQKVTRDMAKDDVLAMFDVPKGLLGTSGEKGLGRNELEPLEYIFAKYTIEPLMERLDRVWQKVLGVNDGSIKVEHESIIPDDKEHNLKVLDIGVGRWITPNEARAQQGLEPLKTPEAEGLNEPKVKPQDPSKTIKRVVLKKEPSKAQVAKEKKETQEQFRKKLVDTNEVYMLNIKRLISKFADTQEQGVIDRLNASTKAYEEWLFSVKEESEALTALLLPEFLALMEAQGEDVANFITGELLTITPEIKQTVEAHIQQIAGVYNADTIKALEDTITEAQTSGESVIKIKKRIEDVYAEAKGYRAERIARTESLRTSNMTASQVYFQNGYSKIEWFVNPGACEFCRTYAGKQIEIGNNFSNIGDVVTGTDGGQMRIEYTNVDTPPLHPNCTCSLVPA